MTERSIGVVQGRLTNAPDGLLQYLPLENWQKEFEIASVVGLDFIEFFIDENVDDRNPLLSSGGLQEIESLCSLQKLRLESVCFDSVIASSLIDQVKFVSFHMKKMESIGFKKFIFPMIGNSSLSDENLEEYSLCFQQLCSGLSPGSEILIESVLDADRIIKLIGFIQSKKAKVLYDTGNVAPLGYVQPVEIRKLAGLISEIHIKDKTLQGENVKLGTGLVDFTAIGIAMDEINFSGNVVFETHRGNNPIETIRENIEFSKLNGLIIE